MGGADGVESLTNHLHLSLAYDGGLVRTAFVVYNLSKR